jgi:hypothetical protein
LGEYLTSRGHVVILVQPITNLNEVHLMVFVLFSDDVK